MLSFFITACSNEDVPVPENEEIEMDGAGEGSIFLGRWYCTQTDNPLLIAESDKMDMYLRYAEIQNYGSFGASAKGPSAKGQVSDTSISIRQISIIRGR